MAVQNLELIGRGFKKPLLSISRVPETVLAFSSTLWSFMMHDEADLTGDAYCNLLNALGRCKNLTHLTLPSGKEFDDTQLERLYAPLSADRPRILCLQTLPTYRRHHLAWNTGASEARKWSWVFHENCPLDLQSVEELIVGNTGVALLLLPLMGSQVVFDGSPLILPHLQRLQFGFCKLPSTWILQAIRAPLIQEIIIQWKDGFGSHTICGSNGANLKAKRRKQGICETIELSGESGDVEGNRRRKEDTMQEFVEPASLSIHKHVFILPCSSGVKTSTSAPLDPRTKWFIVTVKSLRVNEFRLTFVADWREDPEAKEAIVVVVERVGAIPGSLESGGRILRLDIHITPHRQTSLATIKSNDNFVSGFVEFSASSISVADPAFPINPLVKSTAEDALNEQSKKGPNVGLSKGDLEAVLPFREIF
ncbi:MAG: hypothetical protein NXY57DRAFT_1042710 [Lentinula lateritia]|nr:MAG: hypothetical protein NXY57DRAFT_1042710 [Lentinula lateritia]